MSWGRAEGLEPAVLLDLAFWGRWRESPGVFGAHGYSVTVDLVAFIYVGSHSFRETERETYRLSLRERRRGEEG